MSEWQPIETAPKDGVEILAYYDFSHTIGEMCAGIDHVSWDATEGLFFAESPGSGHRCARHPSGYTHWMPLPPPPIS